MTDQLDTHRSAKLVEMVARRCGIQDALGVKGKEGILKSKKTRRLFLEDRSHRIRFVYTPRHCSWLNQVEIWFSILARRLLKRSSFTSLADLTSRTLSFIDYFNNVLGKPSPLLAPRRRSPGSMRRAPPGGAARPLSAVAAGRPRVWRPSGSGDARRRGRSHGGR